MHKRRLFFFLLMLLLTAACSEATTLEDGISNRYQVGDEWTYFTRPGEGLSSFVVTKIDETMLNGEETIIIHITVIDLVMDHPEGGQVTAVPHLPITEAALDRSALQLFDVVDPIPQEYLDAYDNWAERYESGDAFVFQTSIANALDQIQASLSAGGE